ncbi:MAG: electron transfer flavoprotein subunit beta/FixA family protein [Bacteroidales bacterium]|jgi:electron transfer flavoprotein beta subunit|nr:electron transfer flavoprotein subunit beta/FixA family protein [Bacteroidales bacterium]
MSLKIAVLIKQVPDTRNVGKDAMKEDGTINRAALPAIFNPEDLNALEMALHIKDIIPDSQVIVLTMGPARATEILKEALYRGADRGILISDKYFAGSDTLATSYALSLAVKKLGKIDLVFAGRQAIDGDTAQVGPQIAEKLNMPQITYAEKVVEISIQHIVIQRRIERGTETVKVSLPCLITVHSSAPLCRFKNAKRVLKFKKITTAEEHTSNNNSSIEVWNAAFLEANMDYLGLSGSPTKVKKIENVVFSKKENVSIAPTQPEVDLLFKELIDSHIL